MWAIGGDDGGVARLGPGQAARPRSPATRPVLGMGAGVCLIENKQLVARLAAVRPPTPETTSTSLSVTLSFSSLPFPSEHTHPVLRCNLLLRRHRSMVRDGRKRFRCRLLFCLAFSRSVCKNSSPISITEFQVDR